MIDLQQIKKIHFIGLGGIGMSSLSEVFLCQGFSVSGFDDIQSSVIDYLKNKGVKIDEKGLYSNLESSDLVIYSSAISSTHFQFLKSKELEKKMIKRAEALGLLLQDKISFAIAGTHGKTTTTHLFSWIWKACKQDPTVVVGGSILGDKTGFISGKSNQIIVEADEYDRSFLKLFPTYSILNNLEEEHLDCYKDYNDLEQSFIQFIEQTKKNVLINFEDENLRNLVQKLSFQHKKKILTFGCKSLTDYRANDIQFDFKGSSFIFKHQEKIISKIWIPFFGLHNVMNVLSVLSFTHFLKLDMEKAVSALKEFPGVTRRFEFLKKVKGVCFYDDYAHHPKEVLVTLIVAKKQLNQNRLVVVFQPHLYSRTQKFFKEFAESLSIADEVFLAPIFPSREERIEGVDSRLIHDEIERIGKVSQVFDDQSELVKSVVLKLKSDDICLFMGAGDIRSNIGEQIIQQFSNN